MLITECKWGPRIAHNLEQQQPPPDDDGNMAVDDMFDWTDSATHEVTEVFANRVVARRF